ncbi:MAG: hypothetical protein GX605_06390 [Chloroflexi bacterium]|nr:hypothetical protein [Chloroflexota bacterium]
MTTLHQRAIQLVQGHPQINDWAVRSRRRRSHELYLVRERTESRRQVETERAEVEIHRDLQSPEGEPRRGASSFTLLADDSASAAQAKLEQALFAAKLALNPPYQLPEPTPYPAVETLDRGLVEQPQAALDQLASETLQTLAGEPGASLSSAEFFTHWQATRLTNSRGVEAQREGSHLFLEMVILAADGSEESEFFASLERRALQDLDLPAEVAAYAQRAGDSLRGSAPPTRRGPVAVSGAALIELLRFLESASSGAMKYQQLTRWEVGQSIYGGREVLGEPLTLWADRTLPRGVGAAAFDDDGVPGQRVPLVVGGVVQRFWSDYRYAQYLGLPASGSFGNLCVAPGAVSAAQLLADGPLFHIVSFAAMDPDPITGEFVGEIRLGYDVGGGKARPFKGGALSGEVSAALANVRFSRDLLFAGDYHGPRVALFGDLALGGQ